MYNTKTFKDGLSFSFLGRNRYDYEMIKIAIFFIQARISLQFLSFQGRISLQFFFHFRLGNHCNFFHSRLGYDCNFFHPRLGYDYNFFDFRLEYDLDFFDFRLGYDCDLFHSKIIRGYLLSLIPGMLNSLYFHAIYMYDCILTMSPYSALLQLPLS